MPWKVIKLWTHDKKGIPVQYEGKACAWEHQAVAYVPLTTLGPSAPSGAPLESPDAGLGAAAMAGSLGSSFITSLPSPPTTPGASAAKDTGLRWGRGNPPAITTYCRRRGRRCCRGVCCGGWLEEGVWSPHDGRHYSMAVLRQKRNLSSLKELMSNLLRKIWINHF